MASGRAGACGMVTDPDSWPDDLKPLNGEAHGQGPPAGSRY